MDLLRTGQHLFTSFHVNVYKWTGGLIGHRFGRIESVVLTTTGRRSGRPRSTPLTVTPDGDRLILVASNGGAPKHPDWYLNLTADPEVTVQRGRQVTKMRARTATPAERTELWAKVTKSWGGYEGYQRKTEREIPVVVCEPID